MFGRRLFDFFRPAVPPKTRATTPEVSRPFVAGDPILGFVAEDDRWAWRERPMTQEEADLLNEVDPENDEHALEALAGVDTRLRGWRLVLSWVGLIVGAWVVVMAGGYALYTLLVMQFGGVP